MVSKIRHCTSDVVIIFITFQNMSNEIPYKMYISDFSCSQNRQDDASYNLLKK